MNISDMLPSFEAIQKSFEDPQRLHAILVHIPIGLTFIGLLLTLGVTITGSKVPGLRWTTVFIYLLAALAALWTVQTGEEAKAHLPIEPTGDAQEALEKHEALAEFFWIALASTALLLMLSAIRVSWVKTVTLLLALVGAVGSMAWVGAIGHHGGEMVYKHSVGVPSAGPVHHSSEDDKDGKDQAKDAKDAKDGAATKDPVKKDGSKDAAAKDSSVTKDAATKDERKLPDPVKKDASIFD